MRGFHGERNKNQRQCEKLESFSLEKKCLLSDSLEGSKQWYRVGRKGVNFTLLLLFEERRNTLRQFRKNRKSEELLETFLNGDPGGVGENVLQSLPFTK